MISKDGLVSPELPERREPGDTPSRGVRLNSLQQRTGGVGNTSGPSFLAGSGKNPAAQARAVIHETKEVPGLLNGVPC